MFRTSVMWGANWECPSPSCWVLRRRVPSLGFLWDTSSSRRRSIPRLFQIQLMQLPLSPPNTQLSNTICPHQIRFLLPPIHFYFPPQCMQPAQCNYCSSQLPLSSRQSVIVPSPHNTINATPLSLSFPSAPPHPLQLLLTGPSLP